MRRNWRRIWPAAASLLLLPIVVVVLVVVAAASVLYSAVALFACRTVLAVPVAQFLAAMTLRASFVRSLPVACRHRGLVCGTIGGIVSKWRTRPLPALGPLSLIALRRLCLLSDLESFSHSMRNVSIPRSQLQSPLPARPLPGSACQSQCQINRFIELIHRGLLLSLLSHFLPASAFRPTFLSLCRLSPNRNFAFMCFALFCVVL